MLVYKADYYRKEKKNSSSLSFVIVCNKQRKFSALTSNEDSTVCNLGESTLEMACAQDQGLQLTSGVSMGK